MSPMEVLTCDSGKSLMDDHASDSRDEKITVSGFSTAQDRAFFQSARMLPEISC